MRHMIIGWLAAIAACMAHESEPLELERDRAVTEAGEGDELAPDTTAAWQCGGTSRYFEWRCDTMVGQWTLVPVGVESWNCGFPPEHDLDGKRTNCVLDDKYTCGGGENSLCDNTRCPPPPSTPCEREVDPGPCCIKP